VENHSDIQGDTRIGIIKIGEFVCENNRDYLPLFGRATAR